MSKPIVFDASALIALISEEKGAEIVERYLKDAIISTVNLTEVASYHARKGVPMDEFLQLLNGLALKVIEFDKEQALLAARLVPKTAAHGLSLGDRACIALAITRNLPVLTSDRIWKTIGLGVRVEVFR